MANCHIFPPILWPNSIMYRMSAPLKELRKEKGLSQIAVQMQTGIEQALISKYENGERVPPTETLMQLADFYGVSMDYIMGRTDRKEINR